MIELKSFFKVLGMIAILITCLYGAKEYKSYLVHHSSSIPIKKVVDKDLLKYDELIAMFGTGILLGWAIGKYVK